jgi:hypothetical protein
VTRTVALGLLALGLLFAAVWIYEAANLNRPTEVEWQGGVW